MRMESLQIWFVTCLFLLGIGAFAEFDNATYSVSLSASPIDTVAFEDPALTCVDGAYRFDDEPFSGVVYRVLKGYAIETYSSVAGGRLHGSYTSYYASGVPYEVRTYRNGLSTGTHTGYWEDTGDKKFEYHYLEQKKEGTQRTWYATGDPAEAYTYRDDRLDGQQQAWRENGSLYRNFVVRDGIRYGLQKSKTCYEVSDEQVVLQADKRDVE